MKQYVRECNGQMAYFDGQSTFELLEGAPFINLDISQLEERFARPLAQQILLSWIWEKYVKKNSEDREKATKKRVLVDEAWMLLPYPEAVEFLNKMARRARKRNVSLAIISQRFQDFYESPEAQAVLTSSDTKLFLAQDKSEINYLKEQDIIEAYELVEEEQFIEDKGKGEQQKRKIHRTKKQVGPDYKAIVYLLNKHFGREFSERADELDLMEKKQTLGKEEWNDGVQETECDSFEG